jgi:hypothetical protein
METETEAMIEWVLKDVASSYFYFYTRMLLSFTSIWELEKEKKKKKRKLKSIRYGGGTSQKASGLGSIWSALSQALCTRYFTTAILTGGRATMLDFISKL